MGSQTFIVRSHGATAQSAFAAAREQALYDYGHAGYTGTIAEKSDFIRIPRDGSDTAAQTAERLLREDDPRVADKWGPAGCVQDGPDHWLFFGWASS